MWLSALTIPPKAKLLMGSLGVTLTLERRYAAVASAFDTCRYGRTAKRLRA